MPLPYLGRKRKPHELLSEAEVLDRAPSDRFVQIEPIIISLVWRNRSQIWLHLRSSLVLKLALGNWQKYLRPPMQCSKAQRFEVLVLG